eukprot:12889951-Prorocentrum_lima.AAC.1
MAVLGLEDEVTDPPQNTSCEIVVTETLFGKVVVQIVGEISQQRICMFPEIVKVCYSGRLPGRSRLSGLSRGPSK